MTDTTEGQALDSGGNVALQVEVTSEMGGGAGGSEVHPRARRCGQG